MTTLQYRLYKVNVSSHVTAKIYHANHVFSTQQMYELFPIRRLYVNEFSNSTPPLLPKRKPFARQWRIMKAASTVVELVTNEKFRRRWLRWEREERFYDDHKFLYCGEFFTVESIVCSLANALDKLRVGFNIWPIKQITLRIASAKID